ncbi:hypothetical protein, partial [Paenarthrobacter sp. NPDC057981]|uniref:hypothetical protein n=1 Tax=Paenarthrobacter sp. NPDC057981 TaxID=3346297 RepID=UPI0036D8BB50
MPASFAHRDTDCRDTPAATALRPVSSPASKWRYAHARTDHGNFFFTMTPSNYRALHWPPETA